MKLLFEKYAYLPSSISGLLPEKYLSFSAQNVFIEVVGYYHSFEREEMLLILPKIFVENGLFLGNIPVIDFLTSEALEVLKKYHKDTAQIDFIYRFSLDFYLSLREFRARHTSNDIASEVPLKDIISNIESTDFCELDLVFSLCRFYQENRDLLIFKQKETEKSYFRKTNWTKTIRQKMPIIDNETALYIQSSQKYKQQDNENELLGIFFALLQQFKTKYGFHIAMDSVGKVAIEADFDIKSLRNLKKIRHQYFEDKLKKLITLLLIYFEKKYIANTKKGIEEYVLCSHYELVFEDMIDKLLSDKNIPQGLKTQADGKIIDHIFAYPSFFEGEHIFYIGDSKYYKDTTAYNHYNIFKQYTYARNVIQYHIDLSNKGNSTLPTRYRDVLTEGYNPTPNFFIQAYIDTENIANIATILEVDTHKKIDKSIHFENRLFDRDTLILLHFKINYLFVLRSYVEKDTTVLQDFADKAKAIIKEQFDSYLQTQYCFFVIKPTIDIHTFIKQHFDILQGKIYQPFNVSDSFILALEKQYTIENQYLIAYFQEFITQK